VILRGGIQECQAPCYRNRDLVQKVKNGEAQEGAFAYTEGRSTMLIVTGSLTIQDMYARKRALISAIDGATFSISNSTMKNNEAGVDAALIYMNDNRV
jgi:hypothetical protein